MTKYSLVNPKISGTLDTNYTASSSGDAAKDAWDSLSKHIVGQVPKFPFTLKNIDSGSYHHFILKEKLTEGSTSEYTIKEVKANVSDKQLDKLIEQSGGKKKKRSKKDDSSSDDSSEEDRVYDRVKKLVRNGTYPLSYVWYNPAIYRLNTVYVPNWNYNVYTHIWGWRYY